MSQPTDDPFASTLDALRSQWVSLSTAGGRYVSGVVDNVHDGVVTLTNRGGDIIHQVRINTLEVIDY
jgi:hypothetical protein